MSYNPFERGSMSPSIAIARTDVYESGDELLKGTPVKVTSDGIDLIDVSLEADVDALAGVISEDVSDEDNASVVQSGTIFNITTGVSVGSSVYVSKLGVLTDSKPQIGVNGFAEGDFVIKIGTIAKNNDNPSNKDLLVLIQIMGQL